MRVICIDDDVISEPTVKNLVKGNIYNVMDTREVKDFITKAGFKAVDGIYYLPIETGNWYHSSLFVPINENQQDEMELLEQRQSELVNQ